MRNSSAGTPTAASASASATRPRPASDGFLLAVSAVAKVAAKVMAFLFAFLRDAVECLPDAGQRIMVAGGVAALRGALDRKVAALAQRIDQARLFGGVLHPGAVVLGEKGKRGGADIDGRVRAVLDREANDDAHLVANVLARARADEEISRIALEPAGLPLLGLGERVTDLGLGCLADIDAPIAVLHDQRGCRSRARALRRLRLLFLLRRLFRILLLRRWGRCLRERRERQANSEDTCGKASEKRTRGHGYFLSLSRASNPRTRTNHSRMNEK